MKSANKTLKRRKIIKSSKKKSIKSRKNTKGKTLVVTTRYGSREYINVRKSKTKSKTKSKKSRINYKTPKRSSTKRSPIKRKTKSSPKNDFCKALLKEKIAYNMREYKSGRWKSRKQALAVSYSQARKYGNCSYF